MLYRGFCRPCWQQSENQGKRKERRVFGLYQRTKNAVEHVRNCDTNYNCDAWTGHEKAWKED